MANVKNTKQPAKQPPEDAMARVSALIAKAKKEGSIQATELTAELEKLDLPVEKIEQVYDTFDAMGIQIVSPELLLHAAEHERQDTGEDEIIDTGEKQRPDRAGDAVAALHKRLTGPDDLLQGDDAREGRVLDERDDLIGHRRHDALDHL